MTTPILATKLYIPPRRPKVVLRPHLIEQLNHGLSSGRKLTLISASAGFGKTTLLSEWTAHCGCPVAWLSLDADDSATTRFLAYLISALQTLADSANLGAGTLRALQSPQPPPVESILATLLNEIAAIPEAFVLVLDDYHALDSKTVDDAVTFLLDHQPPQMHLVIATREDPSLPLARLRVRDQLTELRAIDLRFSAVEAAGFLNQSMGLNLSPENVAALEARTEGWIAGLQLAAISMKGHANAAGFIESFTGSHRFVLDYLIEEVLHQQSEKMQIFLLYTSILDRMCGPLCDAVLADPSATGQTMLEHAENANLFIIPLDNERGWYRYHHLFGDLLRQRLHQRGDNLNEYHIRASQWYEENGLELEAFQHAAAAHDIPRAERLADGKGIPLHLRGAATMILGWLASLSTDELNARPTLWWKYASLLLVMGQTTGVEEKLQATEAALQNFPGAVADVDNLIGQIAVARATLGLTHYDPLVIMIQSKRALQYLAADNLPYRATAHWVMGFASYLLGDRTSAGRAYAEAVSMGQRAGDVFTTILATIGVANVQELENQLHLSDATYREVLKLTGDPPLPNAADAYLGLARISYEWNDLAAAEQYGTQSLELARQYDRVIDRFILSEVFLARLKLAQGELTGAAALLAQTEQSARQRNFLHRLPEIAAVQVLVLLQQGNLAAAEQLAQAYQLPVSQARVYLAQGNAPAALTVLVTLQQQVTAQGWQDERLKLLALQAVASYLNGEKEQGLALLGDVLKRSEPENFIRIFIDEGAPMMELLESMKDEIGSMKKYIHKILAAFGGLKDLHTSSFILHPSLTPRELEILKLIADGLSNDAICERLFLAVDTVKGHNRRIYEKLQVQRRTEAVARARELGLL